MAPALISASTIAVWPQRAAAMRAVKRSCGHAQAEEQHRGGHTRPSARALKIGTRHQARCRSRESQVPCRLGPVSGDFGGAHVFWPLNALFPPLGPRPDHNSGPQRSNFIKFAPREAPRAPPGGRSNHGRLSLAEYAFEVKYVLKAGRGREVAGGGKSRFHEGGNLMITSKTRETRHSGALP